MLLYVSKNKCAPSSADRVPGYEPVGRGFESPGARQKRKDTRVVSFLFLLKQGGFERVGSEYSPGDCRANPDRVRRRERSLFLRQIKMVVLNTSATFFIFCFNQDTPLRAGRYTYQAPYLR